MVRADRVPDEHAARRDLVADESMPADTPYLGRYIARTPSRPLVHVFTSVDESAILKDFEPGPEDA
jgi:hypothetical protein